MQQQIQEPDVPRTDAALATFVKLADQAQIADFDTKLGDRDFHGVAAVVYAVVRQVSEAHAAELRAAYEALTVANLVRSLDAAALPPGAQQESIDRGAALLVGLLIRRIGGGAPPPGCGRDTLVADIMRRAQTAGLSVPATTLEIFERRRFTVGQVIDVSAGADRAAAELIALHAACAGPAVGDA